MNKLLLLTLSLFTLAIIVKAQEPMVLEFDTNLSDGTTITLPLWETVNVSVNWGDGSEVSFTSEGNKNHTYAEEGTYTVSISGTLTQFGYSINGYNNADKLISVINFGDVGLKSLAGAFYRATNLTKVPDNLPATINDLSFTFAYASSFNQDLNNWDVSNITDLSSTFWKATLFNGNISNWNTSNVTKMSSMFMEAEFFNQDIGSWDVSNVSYMQLLFYHASSFNQDISNWDVSKVESMKNMFLAAKSFNQDISKWNVSNVKNMDGMFESANSFNQDIGGWDVSNVTTMSWLFRNAKSFNQDIGGWNVSSVKNMYRMFDNASSFNQNIGNWDVSNDTIMASMLEDAISFNQDISKWNVSNVKNFSYMFKGAYNFNQNIGNWNVSKVQDMAYMFEDAISFNQDISSWNVSSVTDMSNMFKGAVNFNQDISNWNICNVKDMTNMFYDVKIPTSYYNNILLKWSEKNLQNSVVFNGGNSTFSSGAAADARQSIIDNFGWTITDGGESNLPAVITSKVSEITPVTATSGGEISEDGGSDVIVRGVVWNSTYNPTLDNNNGLTEDGSGMGTFLSNLHDLNIGTKYYVRSYATNANGTEYGNTVEFTASQELHVGGDFFVSDKEYDGTTEASIESSNFNLENIISGHENVELINPLAEFDNKNVGNNKEVSLINASLSGDDSYKYYLTFENTPTSTASITAKELTIGGSFTALDKEYDGTMEAIIDKDSLVLITPIEGDTVMLTGVVLQFSDEEIGEDKTVSIIMAGLEGVDSNNYTLSLLDAPTTTASITQPVGIHSTSLSEVNVYPNPFRDVIHITSTKDVSQVVITNILGKVLVDINYNHLSNQTITTNLPSGVYLVNIIAKDGTRVVRKMICKE